MRQLVIVLIILVMFFVLIWASVEFNRPRNVAVAAPRPKPVAPIRNDADHAAALKEIETLWDAQPGTPEGDRLDVLVTLVQAYEESRWPFGASKA